MAGIGRSLIFLMLAGLFAGPVQAQFLPGPSDHLRGELKAMGVDAGQVDWITLDGLCSVYSQEEEAYEGCLKQKAIDQRQYREDDAACARLERQARQGMMPVQPYVSWRVPPKQFKSAAEQHEFHRYYHQLLRTENGVAIGVVTDDSYEACMSERRWLEPRNWKAGRSEK